MSEATDHLEYFGRFIVENLRDRALRDFELLAQGHWKADALRDLQNDLKSLSQEQLAIVRRTLRRVVDSAIHDFLFAIQEEHDVGRSLEVRVAGQNVAETSDGLHGEPYSDQGWYARYSGFGKPPERA